MSTFDPERLVSFLARFDDTLRVWVAFSGGLDSACLLRGAAAVRERLPGSLYAVHVDHGLHPASATWSAHCHSVCDALAIPLVTRQLRLEPGPGESLEAVAREARYAEFSALLAPGDLLLTAHTQDDQAETLLLALIRGSGVHGLAAMPVVAELGMGRLVRPLLQVTRAQLEHYARTLGLDWVDDPSNRSLSMDRNYLRNLVLPLVRERWPAVSATLSRSAAHCGEAAAVIDQVAGQALGGIAGEHPGTLSIPGLLRLDLPLLKAVLRLWLRRRGFTLPDTAHLSRIVNEVLHARADATPLVAWRGCDVRRYRGDLFALRPLPPVPVPQMLAWTGGTLKLPEPLGTLTLEPPEMGTDTSLGSDSVLSLQVRFGVTEQTCRSVEAAHRRDLKKVFQDRGVPAWLRPYVPFVFDAERLLCVSGVCACVDVEGGDPRGLKVRWSGHPWEQLGFFR